MARKYHRNGGALPLLVLGGAAAAAVYMFTRKDAAKVVGGDTTGGNKTGDTQSNFQKAMAVAQEASAELGLQAMGSVRVMTGAFVVEVGVGSDGRITGVRARPVAAAPDTASADQVASAVNVANAILSAGAEAAQRVQARAAPIAALGVGPFSILSQWDFGTHSSHPVNI